MQSHEFEENHQLSEAQTVKLTLNSLLDEPESWTPQSQNKHDVDQHTNPNPTQSIDGHCSVIYTLSVSHCSPEQLQSNTKMKRERKAQIISIRVSSQQLRSHNFLFFKFFECEENHISTQTVKPTFNSLLD